VVEVVRPDAGGDDETRVRSVSTIAAQPVAAPAPPLEDADRTQLRGVTSVPQAPAPASSPPRVEAPIGETIVRPRRPEPVVEVAPAAEEPRSRRGLIVGILSAVGVLVIGGVIAAVILNGGPAVRENVAPSPKPTTGDSALISGIVPTPVDGVATPSADGATVTFTWVNPDPEDGDTYRYALSENPSAIKPLEEASFTRDTAAGPVCIDGYVVRGGKYSEPLTICYPDAG